jgi:putative (di)nucleoside polyphosphate hydrolase
MSKPLYRDGVVAIFVNDEGKILLCERNDHIGAWQFPQGGLDGDESAEEALFREVKEELGNNKCEILKVGEEQTTYLFPNKVKGFDGARQSWFLCKYLPGEEPKLKNSDCFRAVRWETPRKALKSLVAWKQESFAHGLRQLGLL